MPQTATFATHGRILRTEGELQVFKPKGTNYELHLYSGGGAVDTPVRALVKARGRKAYSVSSGGSFIVPIVGTPRIVQGQVLSVDGNRVVLHAGCDVEIELPTEPGSVDLQVGEISVGTMLNVVLWPGAELSIA